MPVHEMKRKSLATFVKSIMAAALIAVLCVPALAWNSQEAVLRLNKEAPSLETFGDTDAVIWLRSSESRMLADGSMDNLRASILMIGEKVPEAWKTIRFPEPEDGTVTIEEAGWFNTMTGLKEGDLPVEKEILKGGAVVNKVTITDDTVGRAVVIVVRTNSHYRFGVDETVNMADSLPIWEQNVSVEFPVGMDIYWCGRDMKEPVISRDGNVQRYRWQIMNQLPWNGEGFVVNERPMLSFSSRKGVAKSLQSLEDLADDVPLLPMPSVAKGDSAHAGMELIKWATARERTLEGYPQNWVRPARTMPDEGPWTRWEQTLLLRKWLTKLGWQTTLWWESKMPLNDDTPASLSIYDSPILALSPSGNSRASYFKAGIPFSFGRTPSTIASIVVYGLEGDEKYIAKKLPSTSASENRLAFLWKLKLDKLGHADGKLELTATGGWSDLISKNEVPELETIGTLVTEEINFAIPGMDIKPISVSPVTGGYKMSFNVSCAPGIVHGKSLLLRLPGGIPLRVSDMIGKEDEYTLRFPFTIDQKVRISMPRGYHLLQEPPLKQLGAGTKAVLKESITHWPKKADLLADSIWVVKRREVDGIMAQVLREELRAALRWPVLNLPFRTSRAN